MIKFKFKLLKWQIVKLKGLVLHFSPFIIIISFYLLVLNNFTYQ